MTYLCGGLLSSNSLPLEGTLSFSAGGRSFPRQPRAAEQRDELQSGSVAAQIRAYARPLVLANKKEKQKQEEQKAECLSLQASELFAARRPLTDLGVKWQQVPHTCACAVALVTAEDAVCSEKPSVVKELTDDWAKNHVQVVASQLPPPRQRMPARKKAEKLCSILGRCCCRGQPRLVAVFHQRLVGILRSAVREDMLLKQSLTSGGASLLLRGTSRQGDVASSLVAALLLGALLIGFVSVLHPIFPTSPHLTSKDTCAQSSAHVVPCSAPSNSAKDPVC